MNDRIKALEDALRIGINQYRKREVNSAFYEAALAALAASRAASDCQQQDLVTAARVLAEAINSDMETFNKALGTLAVSEDMPTQHFFAEAILAYADAIRAIGGDA